MSTNRWQIHLACRVLAQGGVVVYPTETVWGLGCDPFNEAAVRRLLEIKQRPWEKGLILIAAEPSQLAPYIVPVNKKRMKIIEQSWPGPHTWVFEATDAVPAWIRGKHPSVAVRVTSHPTANALCAALEKPIVSTSANPSGHKATQNVLQVRRWFNERIDLFVAGTAGPQRTPSEIRDARTGEVIRST